MNGGNSVPEDSVLFQTIGITKYYPGVKALNNVDFSVYSQEILALIGENGAGKSTLMKIILGSQQPSDGKMLFKGEPYKPKGPIDALRRGISMIHQEISLTPTLSISENVWIGREDRFGNKVFINRKKQEAAARELMLQVGLDIDPRTVVSKLSIAQKQLVEIARAISYDSDIIIMDEPTSALTDAEVEKLYTVMSDLKSRGKSIIFISHKLEEILHISERVTVLRDGEFINTLEAKKTDKAELISLMVGRSLDNVYPKSTVAPGVPVLEVRNFTRNGVFRDVSFTVRRGEILGFAGLIGAGRTEIVRAVFGVDRHDSGDLFLDGREINNNNTTMSIKNHFSMVTEDRLHSGAIHSLSVKFNMSLAYLNKITKYGIVNKNRETSDAQDMVKKLSIKTADLANLLSKLSGGNQQKVIIAKWLLTDPIVLILDEPTRGIDVGAKAEIYKLMGQLVEQGKAIIMVSSELPELMGICDRIIVIREGMIAGEFQRGDFSSEKIMACAFGVT